MVPDPNIIIVGAGIAGLSFAIMLERAGMQRYMIFEKAPEIRSQGSAIVLSAIVLRCFEQLDLLHELIAVSKPTYGNVFVDEDLNLIGHLSSAYFGERYGYPNIVISRPDLHAILLRHVPAHKILYSKKVLSLDQSSESTGPKIRCSDNSEYRCDIIVGADGAYSGIRQGLYRSIRPIPKRSMTRLGGGGVVATLKNTTHWFGQVEPISRARVGGGCYASKTQIPGSDLESLRVDQHAVIGLTNALDPEKYHVLKERTSLVSTIINKHGFSVWLLPVTGNRICWSIASKSFDTPSEKRRTSTDQPTNFWFSEWGSESVDEILKLDYIKNQRLPIGGGTMQDLFDQTIKGNTCKIMLEDKAFKTWYYKRTVLIGDACHKIIPFTGLGSLHAILDCIILANALYDMPDAFTSVHITRAFREYYAQRAGSASAAVKSSAQVSKLLSGTSIWNHWLRNKTLGTFSEPITMIVSDRIFAYRPILTYLKSVPDHGTRKSDPQHLSRRDREEMARSREERRRSLKDDEMDTRL
ncbi:hypothetical protein B0O80DRAFT_499355 [Mortierella sp. GBAus27b]|nr:hypothetical protein B0O80DRAFT_499355 [Mortierella sp. GBAus27b]